MWHRVICQARLDAPDSWRVPCHFLELAAERRDAGIADAPGNLGKRAARAGQENLGGVEADAAYLLEDAGACDLPEKLFGEAS